LLLSGAAAAAAAAAAPPPPPHPLSSRVHTQSARARNERRVARVATRSPTRSAVGMGGWGGGGWSTPAGRAGPSEFFVDWLKRDENPLDAGYHPPLRSRIIVGYLSAAASIPLAVERSRMIRESFPRSETRLDARLDARLTARCTRVTTRYV